MNKQYTEKARVCSQIVGTVTDNLFKVCYHVTGVVKRVREYG